ncbi:trigger factor [Mycoplasma sp. 4463]|uniref:trigger factor n=1 Tax=Mycoplasma sp. 4463 TaxID=3400998 RepID=UPI003AAA26BD
MITHTKDKKKSEVVVKVKINQADFDKKLKEFTDKLAKKVKVKGYRPGKAPKAEIEKYVDHRAAFTDTVNSFSNENLPAVFEYAAKNKIKAARYPMLDLQKDGEDLYLVYIFVEEPDFAVDPKKLKLEYKSIKVAKKDVDDMKKDIQEKLSVNEEITDKKAKTKLGDTVNINFKGFIDNTPFEGGEAENYDLKLGSKTFIPGFEDQLVGKSVGWKGDVFVTFPADYFVKEYQNKESVFQVSINSIKRLKLFEFTDENVKLLGDPKITDLKSLEKELKNNVFIKKFFSNVDSFYLSLIEQTIKLAKVNLHPSFVEERLGLLKSEFEKQLKQFGMKKTEYLQLIKSSEADLEQEFVKQATKDVENAKAIQYWVAKYPVNASAEQIAEFTSKIEAFGFNKSVANNLIISALRMSLILADVNSEAAANLESDFTKITK